MLLSPFIPTSPSHPFIPMSISLFSISVSPLMPCKQVHQYHRSRVYICVNIRYLFFSFWLTSLCIIGSRPIHLTSTDSNAFFLLLSNIPLYICAHLQCRRPRFHPWVGKIPWRRKWQYTPVLLPGKSHGQRSLVGYSLWGRKESDMTERLHFTNVPMSRSFSARKKNCIVAVYPDKK